MPNISSKVDGQPVSGWKLKPNSVIDSSTPAKNRMVPSRMPLAPRMMMMFKVLPSHIVKLGQTANWSSATHTPISSESSSRLFSSASCDTLAWQARR